MAYPHPAREEDTMNTNNLKGKHLTLEDRYVIEHSLKDGSSFKSIARTLGKDPSTISKEVRNHLIYEKTGAFGRRFNDCIHRIGCHSVNICTSCDSPQKKCSLCGLCTRWCDLYEKEICPETGRPPYVCNGCDKRLRCTLEKRIYKARYANKEYADLLHEARSGFCITEEELAALNAILTPLIKNGQSIHHICQTHADQIHYSEKTLYNFIDAGLIEAINLDLPRKVRFAARKKKSTEFKVDKQCRLGRTYEDYLAYIRENPEVPAVQLDSVEGIKGGAVLLTVHFVQQKLQLAFRRDANDSKSVTDIFHRLRRELGTETYKMLFSLLLADNGSEFSDPRALEFDENGEKIAHVFYCDPGMPGQKGSCENNHEMIRRIIEKGVDITPFSQDRIDLMMSHINSYGRSIIGNKSPYELFEFTYGKDVLDKFGLWRVNSDDIILRPSLLK